MKEKIAIFMDYDNLFWTMLEHYGLDPLVDVKIKDEQGIDLDITETVIDKIFNKFKNEYICKFNAYADFQPIIRHIKGKDHLYKLQSSRVNICNVFGNSNTNENRKNASDIELAMDAIECMITDSDIERFVIISADSDMIPILSRVKYRNKKSTLFYLDAALSKDCSLLKYADENIAIDKDLLNMSKDEGYPDSIIESIYIDLFIKQLVYWYIKNNGTTNYTGVGWFKGNIITYGLKNNGSDVEIISGSNITKILDYMYNKNYYTYEEKPNGNRAIILNLANEKIQKEIDRQKIEKNS